MNRAIARLLLIFLLVSIFAPVALAISAGPVHACCRNGAHHCGAMATGDYGFIAQPTCCDHNCCRPLVRSLYAQVTLLSSTREEPTAADLRFIFAAEKANSGVDSSHSGRAPPSC
ncbi:MAG TPA: hypothetical protein VLW84_01645 [Terriglobales bacterium]|nr:hypothetical protein [Terriglobales bacterium]